MILDLRLAAGLPVNISAIIGLCIGLFQHARRQDETPRAPWWALYHALGMMFFIASASLLFVLPNVIAAILANHVAADAPWPAFAALFAAICVALLWLEMRLLDRIFRTMGGFKTRLTDPKVLAVIGADITLCLLAAAFIPPTGPASCLTSSKTPRRAAAPPRASRPCPPTPIPMAIFSAAG